MSFRKYFTYFRFIQKNWDFKLAAFTIYHEIIGERAYGIDTTGSEQLWEYDIEHKDLKDAEAYQPSSYYILEKLMNCLPNEASSGRIIDFGCGKGRTLAVAIAYGFKKLTGVDIIYEYISAAEQNIRNCKFYNSNVSYDLVNKRAQDLAIPDDSTVFVFFNPFKENVMKKVVENIMESHARTPRKIYVVYMNDVYRNLFLSKGFKQHASVQKLTYLQGVVLTLD
ncbi:MAG: methyltransferase domain-containing protein [Sphingobacteriales bacterium]|nr:MAG: methyltransferase domain-containing protein [Sphingobacteriales bacterium]